MIMNHLSPTKWPAWQPGMTEGEAFHNLQSTNGKMIGHGTINRPPSGGSLIDGVYACLQYVR